MPVNSELARNAIPFLVPDLPSSEDILPYLQRIDAARWYSNFGPLQQEFEQALTREFFPGLNPAREQLVACSSGTAALELALMALKLPAGARVLVPSFTFAASATAIVRTGLVPVFADVDLQSWLLTPEIAEAAITATPCDAILPVAGLGFPQDADAWAAFSNKTGLPVIIDAAAALGQQEIAAGIIVCFSLHATKAFGVGEGGLVCMPGTESAQRVRELSNFGFSQADIPQAGGNYKFSEYQAAVGLAQLARVRDISTRRHRVRLAYQNAMKQLDTVVRVQQVARTGDEDIVALEHSGFHGTAAVALNLDLGAYTNQWFCDQLNALGVGTRLWYTPALHRHSAFRQYPRISPHGDERLLITEWLESVIVGLPFHNFLTSQEIDYICQCVMQTTHKIKVRNPQLINL